MINAAGLLHLFTAVLFSFICTLGVFHALAFAADFSPVAPEFYQRTHRVRLKNLGTTDKKSSRKIKYKKISRVHILKTAQNKKYVLRRRVLVSQRIATQLRCSRNSKNIQNPQICNANRFFFMFLAGTKVRCLIVQARTAPALLFPWLTVRSY